MTKPKSEKAKGFIQLLDDLVFQRELTGGQAWIFTVLVCCENRFKSKGKLFSLADRTLADLADMGRRTTIACRNELAAKGYIQLLTGDKHRAAQYRILRGTRWLELHPERKER